MRRLISMVLTIGVLLLANGPLAMASGEVPPQAIMQLERIFSDRARWLLTDESPPPLESAYLEGSKTALWALTHEKAKIRSFRQWTQRRSIQVRSATPKLQITLISSSEEKLRFYVAQSLAVEYLYTGDEQVNRFGVGSRHIVDLRPVDDEWAISLEWYSDPFGDEGELPTALPIRWKRAIPTALPKGGERRGQVENDSPSAVQVASSGYDREGAVRYADKYCGLAAGCENGYRYNTRFRDYSGEGGNCSNFASQALREGGKLRMPLIMRVDGLVNYLTRSGRAGVALRSKYGQQWTKQLREGRFPALVQPGDLVAYQTKGKMEHVALVTGFDSRGYPLVNSHTLDRYRVPFDLGWDRKTVFWFIKVWG